MEENKKNSKLTIKQVQDMYLAQRTHGSTINHILNVLSNTKSNEPIKNDSYVDALELTDYMFSKTKTSLKILTGCFGSTFLSTLQENFEKAISRVKEQGNQVEVIIIETQQENQKKEKPSNSYLSKLSKKDTGIEIRYGYINKNIEINHMILADDTMTRVEKPHKEISDKSLAESIQANVYLNSPIMNEIQTPYFDKVWLKLQ